MGLLKPTQTYQNPFRQIEVNTLPAFLCNPRSCENSPLKLQWLLKYTIIKVNVHFIVLIHTWRLRSYNKALRIKAVWNKLFWTTSTQRCQQMKSREWYSMLLSFIRRIVLVFSQKLRTQSEDIFLSIFIHSTCCEVMYMQSTNSLSPKVGGLDLPGITAEVQQKQK